MKIMGLDLSLTGTGVAVVSSTVTLKPPSKVLPSKTKCEEPRIDWILGEFSDIVKTEQPDLVVVEGLAFSSKTGKSTERAGLWWLVKMALWYDNIPVVSVAPTTRAMYGTGKGNADKETVFIETLKKYGHIFDIKNNNEADAVILLAMGEAHYNKTLVEVPNTHSRALGSVVWPEPK